MSPAEFLVSAGLVISMGWSPRNADCERGFPWVLDDCTIPIVDFVSWTIWGDKTTAILDVWSIEHILSGISLGHVVGKHHYRVFRRLLGGDHTVHSWHFNLAGLLALAYAWEALEHYLETGLAGEGVTAWFQGVEFWANRLLADPLAMILGYAAARHWPRLVFPSRVASLVWLMLHVFVFPHSMYLQDRIADRATAHRHLLVFSPSLQP